MSSCNAHASEAGRVRAARIRLLTASLLATVVCTSGCGYNSKELYDPNVRTVAVPIVDNRSFYREMEFQLTEALIKEIELRTPYKVSRTGTADTQITAAILTVDQRPLSRTYEGGIAQEMQVVVTASFEWKDLRTGQVIRKRGRLQGSGEYIPTRGVGQPIEVARHQAVGELSRDMVSLMRADW